MAVDQSSSDSVETPYGWFVVAASVAYLVMAYGSSHLIIVSLKPMADAYDWPRWIPSVAYSALMLGAGIGGILMGYWSDKSNIRGPAVVGAVMTGGGIIVASYLPDKWTLIACCGLLVGLLGTSTAFSPMLANVTRWFDRRRGLAIAVVASGQALAGAVWPLVFEPNISTIGWQETWRGYGLVAIFIMLPITFAFRRPIPLQTSQRTGADSSSGDVYGAELIRPVVPYNMVLALLCFAIVGCCVAMAMPMVHLVAYCSDLGFSSATGARMLSLLLLCSAISRLLFGLISDRIGGLLTILLGSAAQTAALGLFSLVATETSLYMVSGLFGLVFGGIVPAYALAVRELFPACEAGWRMGVVFLFGTSGMALGGFLGGWIFDLMGHYHMAFVVGVAFNSANLLAVLTAIWLNNSRFGNVAKA
ncbi:MFS transporter [Ponticaulis sp.]|uniref:MFS transporter n=1 Tax=Ponticaulis sp. TaxID=2020902 RepID=UPI000C541431|nr:MFS transporter [Ponticaulis sp.]MBN06146.1 MFS transporter [Ponticaulis sp.]